MCVCVFLIRVAIDACMRWLHKLHCAQHYWPFPEFYQHPAKFYDSQHLQHRWYGGPNLLVHQWQHYCEHRPRICEFGALNSMLFLMLVLISLSLSLSQIFRTQPIILLTVHRVLWIALWALCCPFLIPSTTLTVPSPIILMHMWPPTNIGGTSLWLSSSLSVW